MSRVSSWSALWLAAFGMALTSCGGGTGGGVIRPGDSVTLLDVQSQIFSPRCALSGCHVGADAPHDLDLSPGAAAGNLVGVASAEMPNLLRVEPFDAADSYLYMKVTGDPRILGDPMPQSGIPLNAADLALIRSWIDQGAQ